METAPTAALPIIVKTTRRERFMGRSCLRREKGGSLGQAAAQGKQKQPASRQVALQLPKEKCDEKLCAKLPKPPRLTVLAPASVVAAGVESDEPPE